MEQETKLADLPSVTEIMNEIMTEMCENYCKYPHQKWEHDEAMYEQVCSDCPLNKLGV